MKVFAILSAQSGTDLKDFAPIIEEEEYMVWQWIKDGLIQQVYSRTDTLGAVVEFTVNDEAEAFRLLNQMPGVVNGLMTYTCIPVKPFDGFEVLFDERFKPGS